MDILPSKILGNGKDQVIVLHDWFGTHQNYKWTYPLWNLEHRTYHFVDLRGHGMAKEMKGEYTLNEASKDLKNYIENQRIDKFSLVCHSMTALIGYKLAVEMPVRALYLATPVPPSGSPVDPGLEAMILGGLPSKEGRGQMLEYLYGGRLSKGWIEYKLSRFFDEISIEAVMGYFKMYVQKRDATGLKIKCPMHVLVGLKDHPPFTKDILEATLTPLGDISWSIHPEVGHAPMEEAPPYVASVESFMDTIK